MSRVGALAGVDIAVVRRRPGAFRSGPGDVGRSQYALRVEALPACARAVSTRERGDVHRPESWIRDTSTRGWYELPRFDHRVESGRVLRVGRQLPDLLEHLQLRYESSASRYRRCARVDGVAAVAAAHGLALRSVVAFEVAQPHRIPLAAEIRDHPPSDGAAVERVGTAVGDLRERPREVGIAQRVAGVERLAIPEEELSAPLVLQEVLALGGERRGETIAHRIALRCSADGRREQLGP